MTQIELAKKVSEMQTLAREIEQVYLEEKNKVMMLDKFDYRATQRAMMIESSYNAMTLINHQLTFNVHCLLLKDGE